MVILTDDLDGTEAQETVIFGLDGRTYQIDLSAKNAAKLRKSLDQYVTAGRRHRSPSRHLTARAGDSAAIREWAQAQGLEVSARGRISAALRQAYAAAN